MQTITTIEELKNTIQQLETKQANEWSLLKQDFNTAYESLKPLNIIKNTLKEVSSSPGFKDNVLSTTVGLSAGYLSKILTIGTSHHPAKKILGTLIQLGVSTIVAKNPDTVKSLINSITQFFRKKEEHKSETINE